MGLAQAHPNEATLVSWENAVPKTRLFAIFTADCLPHAVQMETIWELHTLTVTRYADAHDVPQTEYVGSWWWTSGQKL